MDDLHRQQIENLQKLMESGADLDFDFENADWLNDKQKEICRKYQKNREEVKRLKKQQEQSNNEELSSGNTGSGSTDESEKTCDKCGKKETKYNLPSANDGKEFCSKTCCADYYQQKNDSNQNNSPNQHSNSSSSQNNIPQEINSSPNSNSPSKKPKFLLIAGTKKEIMDYAKKLIQEGKRVEDIDTTSLTESEKRRLEGYQDNWDKLKENQNETPKPGGIKQMLIYSPIIIIPVVLITLIIILRRKKVNRLKKRLKKN